jgi:hypothetical protein
MDVNPAVMRVDPLDLHSTPQKLAEKERRCSAGSGQPRRFKPAGNSDRIVPHKIGAI